MIFFIAALFTLSGCVAQTPNTPKCENETNMTTCGVESIEIPSVFRANFLCKDCQSATSVLALNSDKSFKLETILNKKSAQRIVESGEYSIKADTLTLINQYKEKSEYKFDGESLTKIESKNSFIKEPLWQNLVYKRTTN